MNFRQIKAIEESNKKKWLKINDTLTNNSGIYILFREEDGIKYAYVGQAKHLLTRLAQHLVGYQHIDLSLKKHKLYSEDNIVGWKVTAKEFNENELDEKEQYYIKYMANKGYQLINKTTGSQHEGKNALDIGKSTKGYYDGVKQGKNATIKTIRVYFDKYLDFVIKEPYSKIKSRKYEEFKELLKESDESVEGNSQDIQD